MTDRMWNQEDVLKFYRAFQKHGEDFERVRFGRAPGVWSGAG